MSEDNTGERIRALEVQVASTEARVNRFEVYCKETQQLYRESFVDMNERLDKFINHKVHELETKITDAKNAKRQSLSWLDWTKIVATTVTVVGAIIVALIQAGIIGN